VVMLSKLFGFVVPVDSTMLFRKRDEYPSDAVNVFAEPMEETTHKHFAFHNEDPGVSNKEYDMWFAGH